MQSAYPEGREKSAEGHFDKAVGQLDHATFGYFAMRYVDVPFEPEVGAERRVWTIGPDAGPHWTLSNFTDALRVGHDDLPCSALELRLPQALEYHRGGPVGSVTYRQKSGKAFAGE